MVPTISLGGDLTVPRLGFGTFMLRGEDAYRATRTALEVGYRHIDTAQMYGNEAEVGRAILDSEVDRADLFVTTKLLPSNAAAGPVQSSTEQSLRELQLDHVDLLLLHWPAEPPLQETLGAMTALLEDGRTKAIGVSNFPSALLEEAFDLAPIVNDQVEHHPYLAVGPIEKVLEQRGGFLTAYSPLARGQVADDPVLREIGEAHAASPAQVTLRWLLQKPNTVAIPKSGTPERIQANFDVFGFELSEAEMDRIAGLDRQQRQIDPSDGPDWD